MVDKRVVLGFSITFIVLGLILFFKALKEPGQKSFSNPSVLGQSVGEASSSALVIVSRVIDGDTFEVNLDGKLEKVRYIGIDAPETVDPHRPVGCFGKEASDEDKSLVEGREVKLVADKEDKDQFGRLLRYVYLKLDNNQMLFVNDYLVREGFAKVDTIGVNTKFVNDFTRAQQEAQNQKRGLWQKCV